MSVDLKLAIISSIEILIFMLFLLTGSKLMKKGTLRDDPLRSDNISILIFITYILMQNCDFFSDMYFGKFYHFESYLYFVFIRQRLQTLYTRGGIAIVYLIAAAVFWFSTGVYTYRRLKTKRTVPSKAGIIRVVVALLLYPVVNAVAVYAYGYKGFDSFEYYWNQYVIYFSVIFILRCFRMLPVLIVLLILSWFFIKVIKKELIGIVLIAGGLLFFFKAECDFMLILGGVNYIFFPIGLLAAKYDKQLTGFLKRRCKILAVISAITAVITAVICNCSEQICKKVERYIDIGELVDHKACCYPSNQHFAIFTIPVFLLAISAVVLIFLMLLKLDIVTGPKKLIASATFETVWLTMIPYWYDRNGGLIEITYTVNYALVVVATIIAVLIMCLITKKSPRDYLKKKEAS